MNENNTRKSIIFKKMSASKFKPLYIFLLALLVLSTITFIFIGSELIDKYTGLHGDLYDGYKETYMIRYNMSRLDMGDYDRIGTDGRYRLTETKNETQYQIYAAYNKDSMVLDVEIIMLNLSDEYLRYYGDKENPDLIIVQPFVFINGKENCMKGREGLQISKQFAGTYTDVKSSSKITVVLFDPWNSTYIEEQFDLKVAKLNDKIGTTSINFEEIERDLSLEDYRGFFYGQMYGDNNPNHPWYEYRETGYYCEPNMKIDRNYNNGYEDDYYIVMSMLYKNDYDPANEPFYTENHYYTSGEYLNDVNRFKYGPDFSSNPSTEYPADDIYYDINNNPAYYFEGTRDFFNSDEYICIEDMGDGILLVEYKRYRSGIEVYTYGYYEEYSNFAYFDVEDYGTFEIYMGDDFGSITLVNSGGYSSILYNTDY